MRLPRPDMTGRPARQGPLLASRPAAEPLARDAASPDRRPARPHLSRCHVGRVELYFEPPNLARVRESLQLVRGRRSGPLETATAIPPGARRDDRWLRVRRLPRNRLHRCRQERTMGSCRGHRSRAHALVSAREMASAVSRRAQGTPRDDLSEGGVPPLPPAHPCVRRTRWCGGSPSTESRPGTAERSAHAGGSAPAGNVR